MLFGGNALQPVTFAFDSLVYAFGLFIGDAAEGSSSTLSFTNNLGDNFTIANGPLPDNSEIVFGAIDFQNPFTSVTIQGNMASDGFAIDDVLITSALSEPASVVLFGMGAVALGHTPSVAEAGNAVCEFALSGIALGDARLSRVAYLRRDGKWCLAISSGEADCKELSDTQFKDRKLSLRIHRHAGQYQDCHGNAGTQDNRHHGCEWSPQRQNLSWNLRTQGKRHRARSNPQSTQEMTENADSNCSSGSQPCHTQLKAGR